MKIKNLTIGVFIDDSNTTIIGEIPIYNDLETFRKKLIGKGWFTPRPDKSA